MRELSEPSPRELALLRGLCDLGGFATHGAIVENAARPYLAGLPSSLHNALNRAFDGLTNKGFVLRFDGAGWELTTAGEEWCRGRRYLAGPVDRPLQLFEVD